MSDPETIWLSPRCDAEICSSDRTWCIDPQGCEDCRLPSIKYVRADEVERLRTQLAESQREVGVLRDVLMNPDSDQEPDNIRLHREKCDALEEVFQLRVQLERARKLLKEARQYVSDAGNDEEITDSELNGHRDGLLADIDTALRE